MDQELIIKIIELLGTFAFAISGIRHAAAKQFDWFGGYVCGVAVAIGGGTIRDVMLGTTPFWMTTPIYLICTAVALLTVAFFGKWMEPLKNAWFVFDTLLNLLPGSQPQPREVSGRRPTSPRAGFWPDEYPGLRGRGTPRLIKALEEGCAVQP